MGCWARGMKLPAPWTGKLSFHNALVNSIANKIIFNLEFWNNGVSVRQGILDLLGRLLLVTSAKYTLPLKSALHSSVNGHLDCFHFLATVNTVNTAMNI